MQKSLINFFAFVVVLLTVNSYLQISFNPSNLPAFCTTVEDDDSLDSQRICDNGTDINYFDSLMMMTDAYYNLLNTTNRINTFHLLFDKSFTLLQL